MIKVSGILLCAALLQGCGGYRDGPVLQSTRFGSGMTVVIQAYAEGDVMYPVFVRVSAKGRTVESAPFLYLLPSDVKSKKIPFKVREVGAYVVILDEADSTKLLAMACPKAGLVYPRAADATIGYLNSVSNAISEVGALLGDKPLKRP